MVGPRLTSPPAGGKGAAIIVNTGQKHVHSLGNSSSVYFEKETMEKLTSKINGLWPTYMQTQSLVSHTSAQRRRRALQLRPHLTNPYSVLSGISSAIFRQEINIPARKARCRRSSHLPLFHAQSPPMIVNPRRPNLSTCCCGCEKQRQNTSIE